MQLRILKGGKLVWEEKGQIVEVSKIEVEIEEIQGCFPAPILMRGNSYYVRLDPSFVRFWGLKPDDEILMTVTKAKRETKKV